MSIDEILVSVGPRWTRAALLDDGRLVELHVEAAGEALREGDIHLGIVRARGAGGRFVDIGGGSGLLPGRKALLRRPDGGIAAGAVGGDGQVLLVQVSRLATDDKGTRLSADLRLVGRYLALTPLQAGVSLARHAADEAARAWLREARAPGGLELRPAARRADAADLAADLEALAAQWQAILAAAVAASPPARVWRAPGAVEACLRDYLTEAVREVVVDRGPTLAALRRAAPLPDRLAAHRGPAPLFARHEVEAQIAAALAPRVELPGGGWIAIEPTAALTAVDVNSGGDTEGGDRALRTNLEAAEAIARQLRLRDIGGVVVVDFLRMTPGSARQVLRALRRALAGDPAPVETAGLSRLGLLELTRGRQRRSLAAWWTEACPACDGGGRVPTVAAAVEAAQAEAARVRPGRPLRVRAAPPVAAALRQAEPGLNTVPDPALAPRGWRLEGG